MEKTLKVIFVLTLVALALGDLGRIQFENGIAITGYDGGVGILVLAWFISLKRKKEIASNVLLKPILIFACIAALSLLINFRFLSLSDFSVSLLYVVRWIFYAGIYFVVNSFDSGFKRRIPLIMIFISFIFVVVPGYIQYFFYPDLRNLYYLGWDEHLYRMFSSFLDPNFAAVVFSLLLILILAMRLGRIGFLLAGLTFVALLLTYSRGGYVMFFTSILVLSFLLNKKRYIFVLLLSLILGIVLIPKNLEGEGVKLLRSASVLSRIESSRNAIKIFSDNPILGVGFNAYRYAQYRYGFLKGENWRVSHSGAGANNSFLSVLATAGIVGFLSYLYLWFCILKRAYQGYPKSVVSVVVIASAMGLFLNAFFINILFFPFIMAWMWTLLGLTENS